MVLQPIFDPEPAVTRDFVPAWNAIEWQQTAAARGWWLIPQAAHAALSGEIAAHFSAQGCPKGDAQIVRAIAKHDAGWELFEADPKKPPCVHPDGRPVSFFEVRPQIFLQAWTASIDRVEEESAMGAYVVSQHFCWLGEYRLNRVADPPDVRLQIDEFITRERQRQSTLYASAGTPDWNSILPLLQFCDLFSLYLCSGARQPVEFPQELAAGRVRARFEDGKYVLSPTPFAGPWSATLTASLHRRDSAASDFRRFCLTVK